MEGPQVNILAVAHLPPMFPLRFGYIAKYLSVAPSTHILTPGNEVSIKVKVTDVR